jgi:hypothetical protein
LAGGFEGRQNGAFARALVGDENGVWLGLRNLRYASTECQSRKAPAMAI